VPEIPREQVLKALEAVLSSDTFQGAERSAALLRYIVRQAVDGHADRLKEFTLGVEALGRGESFDPRADPIVRAEASRLRSRLEKYYAGDGSAAPLVIEVPKGSYVPLFRERAPVTTNAPRERRLLPRPNATWIAWGIAVGASALALTLWISPRARPRSDEPLVRLDVELRSNGTLGSEVGTDVILSPDGTRVVFVSRAADGIVHLNVRRLDQSDSMQLPGTEGARAPFFSPDGRWVGFWAAGQLKKTSIDSGSPIVLWNAARGLGASWGADGHIIANLNSTGVLSRIPSAGGTPATVVDLTDEFAIPAWPQILPGGEGVLFTRLDAAAADRASIEAYTFSNGRRSVVLRDATYGRYVPSGYLTYINQGTLFAVAFDPRQMAIRGTPFPVLEDVSYSPTFGYAQVDFSQTGTLVYRTDSGQLVPAWLDSAGEAVPAIAEVGRYGAPRLSPQGDRLVVTRTVSGMSTTEIHGLYDRGITRGGAGAIWTWSPGGRFLVGGGGPGGGIVSRPAADPDKMQPLMPGKHRVPWSFSPDGKRLAYHEMGATTGFDLWTVPIELAHDRLRAGTPEPFLQSPSFEVYPSFSPDGRWLAYSSNESGRSEIYVRAFPDNGTKVRVSVDGGRVARWLPNKRQLLYRTDDQRLMVVDYSAKDGVFRLDMPRLWTSTRLADTGVLANFDIAPDGARIVALLPARGREQAENHATFLLNFFDEVRRRDTSMTN
jgi:serine/threonine-protein kinase